MGTLIPSSAIPQPALSIAFGSVTDVYQSIGQFKAPIQYMIIISNMSAECDVSFDGVNLHVPVPTGTDNLMVIYLPFRSNLMSLPDPYVYVKSSNSPSSGTLWVCGFSSTVS